VKTGKSVAILQNVVGADPGKTKESVVRWGAVSKYSEGRSMFYLGFSMTENIILGVDEI